MQNEFIKCQKFSPTWLFFKEALIQTACYLKKEKEKVKRSLPPSLCVLTCLCLCGNPSGGFPPFDGPDVDIVEDPRPQAS